MIYITMFMLCTIFVSTYAMEQQQNLWVQTTDSHLTQVSHAVVKASNLLTVLNEKYKGSYHNPIIIPTQLPITTDALNLFATCHAHKAQTLHNTLASDSYYQLIDVTEKLKARKKYIQLIRQVLPQEDEDKKLDKIFSSHITEKWIANLIRNDAIQKKHMKHDWETGESHNTSKPKLYISDNGNHFAHGISFGFDSSIKLCNTTTNAKEYKFWSNHRNPVNFSPNSNYIISKEIHGVHLYDIKAKQKYLLIDHQNPSFSITISDNSQHILIEGIARYTSSTPAYTLWTLDTQGMPQSVVLKDNLKHSYSVVFHPDNEHIIHTKSKLYLYDILTREDKKLIPNMDKVLHLDHNLRFSPDKTYMLCSALVSNESYTSSDVLVNVKNFTNVTATSLPQQSFHKKTRKDIPIIFIPHKNLLTHITDNGCTLQLLDEHAMPIASHTAKEENTYISALAVDNSGNYLASGYSDGTITIWNLSDAKNHIRGKNVIGSQGTITKLTFTDNQLLLSQSKSRKFWPEDKQIPTPGSAILWDVHGNEILNFGNNIVNSRISKNGKKVVTIAETLHWNDKAMIPNWTQILTLTCHNLDVTTDAFTLKQALKLCEYNEIEQTKRRDSRVHTKVTINNPASQKPS